MKHSVKYVYSKMLLHAREQKGLSQVEAAERCGVCVRQYQKLEGGKSLPRFKHAIHIAWVMHFSLDELVRQVYGYSQEEVAAN